MGKNYDTPDRMEACGEVIKYLIEHGFEANELPGAGDLADAILDLGYVIEYDDSL